MINLLVKDSSKVSTAFVWRKNKAERHENNVDLLTSGDLDYSKDEKILCCAT